MTRICFLEQPGKRSSVSMMPLLIERLHLSGCSVEIWVPEKEPTDLRALELAADLYVWKSHERLCDSVAACIEASGIPLLNGYFSTLQVRDKIVTAKCLMDAGLPTPQAYYADSIEQLRAVVKSYPIVVKPNAGRRGERIEVVRSPEKLERLPVPYRGVFAQRYVSNDGLDLKAYVIGEQVFGVARPFPVRTVADKRGKPRAISPEVREICLRCGELFGLELYGVDLIETADGPYVIEVNCFPGYKGVPDADRLLADYILSRAGKEVSRTTPACEIPPVAARGVTS